MVSNYFWNKIQKWMVANIRLVQRVVKKEASLDLPNQGKSYGTPMTILYKCIKQLIMLEKFHLNATS